MSRSKPLVESAAGRLISAIQKEWGDEVGTDDAVASENVMHSAHHLLQASKNSGALDELLGARSIEEFLGRDWVKNHPRVHAAIAALQDSRS